MSSFAAINKSSRLLSAGVLATAILVAAVIGLTNKGQVSKTIVDVSYPNCGYQMKTDYTYGIVGVTGGLDFHTNPCLNQQVTWFNHYDLYINTGYPGNASKRHFPDSPLHCQANNDTCLAYNYGYNAALYGLNYANKSNAHAGMWWLDVETENSWSSTGRVNRASLIGEMNGILANVPFSKVGFYSYPGQWAQITDNWSNGLPAWAATAELSRSAASKDCRNPDFAFTGGPLKLAQYTVKLDENVACS